MDYIHQGVTWDSETFRCFSLSRCWNMASPSLVLSMFQPIASMLFSDSLTGQRYVSLSYILNTHTKVTFWPNICTGLCSHQMWQFNASEKVRQKHLIWKWNNFIKYLKGWSFLVSCWWIVWYEACTNVFTLTVLLPFPPLTWIGLSVKNI